MGKVTRWLRSLLLGHKTSQSESSSKKTTRKWSLAKSRDHVSAEWSVQRVQFKNVVHESSTSASPYTESVDADKHAIAMAAATAAVAEAALAAAHAAAEVVRLTHGGVGEYVNFDRRRIIAAVKIQSAYRACLARRAFRALKGLVKLQALVRGCIVRNRSTIMLHRMQAMARIQARASTHRSYVSEPSTPNTKFSNNCHSGIGIMNHTNKEIMSSGFKQSPSPRKQHCSRSRLDNKESSNLGFIWLDQWTEQSTPNNHNHKNSPLNVSHNDYASDDKILEIDTWNPRQNIRKINRMSPVSEYFSAWNNTERDYNKCDSMSRLSAKLQYPNPSISSEEVSYVRSPLFAQETDRSASWTAENSPNVRHALSRRKSHRRLSFTPTRNKCLRSLVDNYFGHPNYMANTESSLAKLRSHSVPKQRIQHEESGLGGTLNPVLRENDIKSEKGFDLKLSSTCNNQL